jgi:hypothetical protein
MLPSLTTGALVLALAAGCAQTQPTADITPGRRGVPGKCSACHLAPREHSLAAERWEGYLKSHKRRLRLSDEEKVFLYDFLVGGTPPTAVTKGSADN